MKWSFLLYLMLVTSGLFSQAPRFVLPEGHTGFISQVDFSPDGKLALTASGHGSTVKLWDTRTGQLISTYQGSSGNFSMDGKDILIRPDNFINVIYRVTDESLVNKASVVTGLPVEFINDPVSENLGYLDRYWKYNNGLKKQRDTLLKNGKLISISNNKKYVLVKSNTDPEFCERWEIRQFENAQLIGRIPAQPGNALCKVLSAEFSPDNRFLVSRTSFQLTRDKIDYQTLLWESATGKPLVTFNTDIGDFAHIKFSNKSKYIISWKDSSQTSKIWETATAKLIAPISIKKALKFQPNQYEFDPNEEYLAVISENNTINIIELKEGRILYTLQDFTGSITSMQFNADGQNLLTLSTDSTVRIWNVKTGNLLATFGGSGDRIFKYAYSADKKYFFTFSLGINKVNPKVYDDGTISIIETKSWHPIKKISGLALNKNPYNYQITGLVVNFSLDGKYLIGSMKQRDSAKIWRVSDGQLVTSLSGNTNQMNSKISPDMRYIVSFYNNQGLDKKSRSNENHSAIIRDISDCGNFWNLEGLSKYEYATMGNSEFSPDGTYILVPIYDSGRHFAGIWQMSDGKLIAQIDGHNQDINSAQFSPDEKMIVTTGASDHVAKIWRAETGELLGTLVGHTAAVNSASFTNDGKRIITASSDGKVKIWQLPDLKEVFQLSNQGNKGIQTARLSPDKKLMLTVDVQNGQMTRRWHEGRLQDGFEENFATVWDLESKKPVATLTDDLFQVNDAYFLLDSKSVVTTYKAASKLKIWDLEEREMVGTLEGIENIMLDQQGRWAVVNILSDGGVSAVATYNFSDTTKKNKTITSRYGELIGIGKNSQMFAIEQGSLINVYYVESAKPAYSFANIDSTGFFVKIPSGYFQCSTDAARSLHYVTKDLKVITFDQLDVQYNRPDKVLEALGNKDTALIKSYRRAWEKRIQKLGIDTTAFHAEYSIPDFDFMNRESIEPEQKNERLTLHMKGADSIFKLDRFNIWINEAPVFGQRGITIRMRNLKTFDTTITIILSQGENRVETSVTNVNGIESYRIPLFVRYTPSQPKKEMVYFIGIGINRFADTSNNLQYCAKDIRDLTLKLQEKYGSNLQIDTLFNEDVTIEKVKALKQRLQQSTENDKVIIAYSGHGLLSRNYDYFLSTYNINFSQPEQNGLPYDELENLVDGIGARRKLMLIDACHSGEVDKEEMKKIAAIRDKLKKENEVVEYKPKGIPTIGARAAGLGVKNSFELMQQLFLNVGRATGTTIISAASGTQFALERKNLQNGVFTFSVMELLKPGQTVMVSELKRHVINRVSKLTNGLQQPTTRNELQYVDWVVW